MIRIACQCALALVLLTLIAGCPAREVSKIDPNQQKEEYKDIPVDANRDIDILFVIDNSGSMGQEQTALANNFDRFMSVLENIEGGLPNVHIGVISSNVGVGGYSIMGCSGDGDGGRLQNAARDSCTPPSGYYIADTTESDGSHTTNYDGTLAETFACIAQLGVDGCGLEQHLKAVEQALDPSTTQNAGFLRDDAYLAIIIVADEDDCSANDSSVFDTSQTTVDEPLGPLSSFRCTEFGITCNGSSISRSPAEYDPVGGAIQCEPRGDSYLSHPQEIVDYVKSLKDDPNLIIAAGIIGNVEPFAVGLDTDGNPDLLPSCSVEGTGEADPGVRLKYFIDSFTNHTTTSICNEDYSDALEDIAGLLARTMGTPCLEGNVDTTDLYPSAEGIQIDCQVSDVQYPNTDQQTSQVIPRCLMADDSTPVDASAQPDVPCWYVYEDAENCSEYPTSMALVVERGGGNPERGTHVIARCRLL